MRKGEEHSVDTCSPALSEIGRLEISLVKVRQRLHSAVNQGAEHDRATLRSEVGALLDKIAKLKAIGRFRR
jgi:hypothetical protein